MNTNCQIPRFHIPITSEGVSEQSLDGRIVTWRDNQFCASAPGWLPLRFVENWFRDGIIGLAKDYPIRLLLAELQIAEPSDGILLKALAIDIVAFWKNKQGDPGRFIKFLAAGDFHEHFTIPDSHALLRCPIPARIEGQDKKVLVQAQQAYFGSEWGEKLLAELFDGVLGVAWAERPENDAEKYRTILTWLGVSEYPRLVENTEGFYEESSRVRQQLPYCTEVGKISAALSLEKLDFKTLNLKKTQALLRLLVRHWRYYGSRTTLSVQYKYYSWYSHSVNALWWEQLKSQFVPPLKQNFAPSAPLANCWLPDRAANKAVGDLLPTIVRLCTKRQI
jgi:hypothetical protein